LYYYDDFLYDRLLKLSSAALFGSFAPAAAAKVAIKSVWHTVSSLTPPTFIFLCHHANLTYKQTECLRLS
jgi:hypothetical protein